MHFFSSQFDPLSEAFHLYYATSQQQKEKEKVSQIFKCPLFFGMRRNVLYHVNGLGQGSQSIQDELQVLTLRCSRQSSVFGVALTSEEQPTYSLSFYPVPGPRESLLALAKEEGMVALEDVSSRSTLASFQAHSNAIFDLTWSPCGSMLASASGDKSLRIWDVESLKAKATFDRGHDRCVRCLQFSSSGLIASGSRDGSVLLWDQRNPEPLINGIKDAHRSVTSLQFLHDEHYLATTGATDGAVKIWDLRKNYSLYKRTPLPTYSLPRPGEGSLGFTSLALDSRNTLFALCSDDKVYRYSLSSYDDDPLNVYSGLNNNSCYVRISLSPDEKYLTSGSSDGYAYLWRVNDGSDGETSPVCRLQGHATEVTCVEWCKGGWTLVTCSDDFDHCVWTPDRRENKEDLIGFAIRAEPPPQRSIVSTPRRSAIPSTTVTPPGHFTPSSLRKRRTNNSTPSSSKKRRLTPSILNFLTKSGSKMDSSDNLGTKCNIENVSPKGKVSSLETIQESSNRRNISRLLDEVAMEKESSERTPLKFDKYPCSPTKMTLLSNKDDLESPKRLTISSPLKPFSPTANLPNYIIDRKTPSSSSKKRERPLDWLTTLGNQKKSKAAKKL